MSIRGRTTTDRHGDPVLTITVEGFHDIYRVTHNLVRAQCDIARVGQTARAALRRKAGAARWRWLIRQMHGVDLRSGAATYADLDPHADRPARSPGRRPPWRTYVENEAVRVFAASARKPEKHWVPVHSIEFGQWYDCACPLTRRISQVMMRPDGTWHQAPLGDMPVILEYLGTSV